MENNTPQQHTPVSLPQPVVDEPQLNTSVAPQPPSAPSAQPAGSAQDLDIIEQEWINKVNQLIQQTVGDPRVLSKEFEKLKAQYIAGRYGKEVKRSGEKG